MKRNDGTFLNSLPTILLAVLILVGSAFANGSNEQVLHRFQGADGANPYGNLIFDKAGNLYGTTEYMGVSFYGTVFQLAPPAQEDDPWTLTTLYSFLNDYDGARPTDGLIFDRKGNLYGTTSDSAAGGYGEIFQLSPPATKGGEWTETVLYHFQGGTDGAYPQGGLIADEQGNFYGATESSVFELSPPAHAGGAWRFSLLHDFTGGTSDGWSPHDGLVRDGSGNLYGSTLWGGYEGNPDCGEIGCGTVFEVSPPAAPGGAWTEQVLHSFGMGDDGFDPEGGLALDAKGNLYGTTYSGGKKEGGTAFRLAPPSQSGGAWMESVIHAFSYSRSDGAAPVATMVLDLEGNLYGTTMFGGEPCFFDDAYYGCGIVFKLSPQDRDGTAWHESVLYFFQPGPSTAKQPAASLLFDNYGNLYGTTVYGGTPDQQGTVFRIVP
jgi:uncharacterized repeat protein (TIGR03803 family)